MICINPLWIGQNPIENLHSITKFSWNRRSLFKKIIDFTKKNPWISKTVRIVSPIFLSLYGLFEVGFGTYQLSKDKKYSELIEKNKIHRHLKSIFQKVLAYKRKIHESEICGGLFCAASGGIALVSVFVEGNPLKSTIVTKPLLHISNHLYLFSGILYLFHSAQILHEVNQTIAGKKGLELEILKDIQRMMILSIISSICTIISTSLALFGVPILICLPLRMIAGSLDIANIMIDLHKGGLRDHIKKIIQSKR